MNSQYPVYDRDEVYKDMLFDQTLIAFENLGTANELMPGESPFVRGVLPELAWRLSSKQFLNPMVDEVAVLQRDDSEDCSLLLKYQSLRGLNYIIRVFREDISSQVCNIVIQDEKGRNLFRIYSVTYGKIGDNLFQERTMVSEYQEGDTLEHLGFIDTFSSTGETGQPEFLGVVEYRDGLPYPIFSGDLAIDPADSFLDETGYFERLLRTNARGLLPMMYYLYANSDAFSTPRNYQLYLWGLISPHNQLRKDIAQKLVDEIWAYSHVYLDKCGSQYINFLNLLGDVLNYEEYYRSVMVKFGESDNEVRGASVTNGGIGLGGVVKMLYTANGMIDPNNPSVCYN